MEFTASLSIALLVGHLPLVSPLRVLLHAFLRTHRLLLLAFNCCQALSAALRALFTGSPQVFGSVLSFFAAALWKALASLVAAMRSNDTGGN